MAGVSNVQRLRYWQGTRATFIRVITFIGKIIIAIFIILVITDWFTQRDQFGLLLTSKIPPFAVILGSLVLLRTQRGRDNAVFLAIFGAYIIFATAVAHSIIIGEQVVPFAALFGVLASATMVPWRPRYHAVVAIGAIVAVIFSHAVVSPTFFTFNNEVVASIVLSLASIILAFYQSEQSFALWQAQAAVREGEERFRQLGDYSEDIIWIWSLDRTIQYVSPAYKKFTGLPVEALYTNAFLIMDMVHPEDRTRFSKMIDEIMEGNFRKMDLRIRHRDGAIYWLDGWGSPIYDQNGDIVRCIGIWHDITDRIQLVNELNAYAHTVAHDLKAPLSVIIGFITLLEEDLTGKVGKNEQEAIETISRTAMKMVNIIDELLILASVRDMSSVTVSRLDMTAIVQHVQDRFVKLIKEKQATIILPDEWLGSLGYAPWIEEIWANYLSNALKYGGNPPHIEFGSTLTADHLSVRYWVKDNGRGLDQVEIAHVFDQFSRFDTERADGHGMGLSIVKRIAEKLGGEVGVESERGSGSTFYFELPAVDIEV